jgi:hypothetical protein
MTQDNDAAGQQLCGIEQVLVEEHPDLTILNIHIGAGEYLAEGHLAQTRCKKCPTTIRKEEGRAVFQINVSQYAL